MNQPEDPNSIKIKEYKLEKMKVITDALKWLLVTFLLGAVTIHLDNKIKDRNTGLQEMLAYDKYVDIILKVNNIEERWKLAEYFIAVSTTDKLKKCWANYQEVIKPEYDKFIAFQSELKNKESEIARIDDNDTARKAEIKKEINAIQHKMDEINKGFPVLASDPYLPNFPKEHAQFFLENKEGSNLTFSIPSQSIHTSNREWQDLTKKLLEFQSNNKIER